MVGINRENVWIVKQNPLIDIWWLNSKFDERIGYKYEQVWYWKEKVTIVKKDFLLTWTTYPSWYNVVWSDTQLTSVGPFPPDQALWWQV